MQWRNPKYNQFGTIDVEIEHPSLGWIPFTASPDDVEEHGRQIFVQAQAAGPAPYEPPAPPTSQELDQVAEAVTTEVIEHNLETKALAMVLADVVERAFNVSTAQARQQVRDRYLTYYRQLLDN